MQHCRLREWRWWDGSGFLSALLDEEEEKEEEGREDLEDGEEIE